MHHVRKGELWDYEERARISRIGDSPSFGGTPYPSAWRGDVQDGLRRGGSLRVAPKPRLNRMSSAESLKASDDAVDGASSPAGVRLWAKWSQHRGDHDAVSILLADSAEGVSVSLHPAPIRQSSWDEPVTALELGDHPPYADGTPAMPYLDSADRVGPEIRHVLQQMVSPLASERPSAEAVRAAWNELGL
jgi:hypothetical protein